MSVYQTIDNDLKEAMKNKDSDVVNVLRLLKSAFKNAEIAKGSELSEEEVVSQLEKQAKQRKDSIEQYRNGNRDDLAQKEELELNLISKYLPQKMSADETRELINTIVKELGATEMSQMGNVMKALRDQAGSGLDNALAANLVKEILS